MFLTYDDLNEVRDSSPSWSIAASDFSNSFYSFKAAADDPDTFDYGTAMSSAYRTEWRQAAKKEISALEDHKTWKLDKVSNATSKILPGTWVFKLKRDPDGNPTKYKARYCVRGDLMEGDPETFAPVVAWSSVRIFLVFSMILGWQAISIDFSNAFVQAKLEEPMWIHLPRGFHVPKPGRYCLKLLRSLYGISIAPKLWFEHCLKAFLAEGFKQSAHDPCFLYKKDMLLVLYVDDAGICAKNTTDIDTLVESLRKKGFLLTKEDSFSAFLGIKITLSKDQKSLHMTQRGLIDKIVTTTGLEDANPNWTPAPREALGKDPDGPPMSEKWNYRSVVGMLLYLSTNTRPDIAYAVSQVARFSHDPKQSHATAVKMLVRYLRRTRDFGTIVSPTNDMNLECYVDADFAGLYRRDPEDSPSSVRSRTGYILFFGGFPLIWKSNLMSEISLSTLEAEYSSLSSAVRVMIPIRSLLHELVEVLDMPDGINTTINSTVFEDNNGALILANTQRITNRTRYFQVKWHFFWEYVKNGLLKVCWISTDKQRADMMTKQASREVFERLRKLNQGW